MDRPCDFAKKIAPWLWLLMGLFALRIVAQPLALFWDWLPAFEEWHSATLPYFWLVLFQVLILPVMIIISARCSAGGVRPSPRLGLVLLSLGAVYMGVMSMRLVLGMSVLRGGSWFDRPLPTIF